MLKRLLAGALLACCLVGMAWAGAAEDPYGFAADDVAENQGAVAYWYAHGFANAFGHFPADWAELQSHGMPLRDFVSPHTGQAINFDDGSLDFDGDMMYVYGDWDVEIHVQTSDGVFMIPGTISGVDECCDAFCCEIQICETECWDVCGDEDAICKILGWMMWKSFETYECRYGTRPCDEKAWMASGFAPIGMNWRELAPFMDIEYVWGNCYLKKAYVNCCPPCNACKPCAVDKCGKCNKCKTDTCTTCKPKCKSDCGGCDTCKPKCKPDCKKDCCKKDNCVKCKQDTCTTCKPACKPDCQKDCCKPKCSADNKCGKCNMCKKDNCVKCKQDTCTTCKPACKPDCKKECCAKPKCAPDCKKPCCAKDKCVKCKTDTCTTCKPKCKPDCKKECCAKTKCAPDCKKPCCAKDKCVKCKTDTCTTCKPKCSADNKCGKCDTCKPKCKSDCGGCDKCAKDKCVKCKTDTCTTCKPKCNKC